MRKQITLILFYLMFGAMSVLGQTPLTDAADRVRQDPGNQEARRRYEMEQRREEQMRESGRDSNGMMINPVNKPPVKKSTRAEEKERAKIRKESMKMLEPSAEYYDKYKNFLAARNTGIARIFSDRNCVSDKVISVSDAERCADVPNAIVKNGSLYSFALGKNYLDFNNKKSRKLNSQGWWDIHFNNQEFLSGNCCTQGIIVNLGDVAIESLDADSPSLSYLVDFKAKETVDEIQEQNLLLNQGIKFNGYVYQKKTLVQVNNTYAVRSISYSVEKGKDAKKGNQLKAASDILTVFRVVDISDGKSLVVIWKQLTAKPN